MVNTVNTLPKLLAERAETNRDEVALRQKYLGVWSEITWGEYYEKVEQLAIVLEELYKFNDKEKLVVIGENRPQWLYAQMATQVLGGISVGIYQESLPSQLIYYLNDCQARIIVVEDQEQVDKLLEIEKEIPFVEHIIYYHGQGMRHYNHPKLVSLDDLLLKGKKILEQRKGFFRDKTERSLESDIAIIAYSAATTGDPKGAMLTHNNLIDAAKSLENVDRMEEKDDYISFFPLAWIHEQILTITIPLIKGSTINFPERPSTVLSDLREIGPHTLLAPPRVYQTLMSNFTTRIHGATWFKKKIFKWFKTYGDKFANHKLADQPMSVFDKLMYTLGDLLVFSAIRDHYGLARIKRAYTAGAALSSEVYRFYHSIGVNLKQTYGGTELAGIAFVHRDDDILVESAGKPLPNTEVKIGEGNEIFVKNPAIFAHYLNEAHEKEVRDGWLSLGDCGFICEKGHLHIQDRKENIIEAPNGEIIYPSEVENKLKVSPYIQEAITFGKDKPFMTAMLNIDMVSVGRFADRHQLIYTGFSDLSRSPEVIELITSEVKRLMKELPTYARVKKFILLHKQFNANDGELTRTLKMRRKFVKEKYKALIEQMYESNEAVDVTDGVEAAEEEAVRLQVVHIELEQGEVA